MKGFSIVQQVGFWFFLLFSMILITQSALTWAGALERSLVMAVCYAVNFYLCFLLFTPYFFERQRYAEFVAYMLLMQFVLLIVRFHLDARFPHHLVDTRGKKFFVIIFTNITVSSFSVMLRLSLSRLDYERKYAEKEKEQVSTELLLLKSQIQPHFLFNTLNNLYTLILQKSDKAADALMRLSDLLRYLLYECDAPRVQLRKEIDAMRSFIALYQLKYEYPANVHVAETGVTEGVLIEPMLLIPLIENAFKYSDIDYNPVGYIRVEVEVTAGSLRISIRNTTDTVKVHANEVGGIGLRNVRRRLDLSYGKEYNMEVTDLDNFFSVHLTIPKR
ncbi:MAG: histidine kinase [Bacteroidetes bacterium]|nr:histidine kinase [Bacteroidota bacterium]